MISYCGLVWGKHGGSYIYAIFKGECLYFGETGNPVPVRWGQHFSMSSGNFAHKLNRFDPSLRLNSDDTVFIGVQCTCIDAVSEANRKIARRAVEEELHRCFLLNGRLLSPAIQLLSTAPPAPVRHTFPFDPKIVANQVYAEVASRYQNWLGQRMTATGGAQN